MFWKKDPRDKDAIRVPRGYRDSLRDVAIENGWSFIPIRDNDWFTKGTAIVVVHYSRRPSMLLYYAEVGTAVGVEVLRTRHELFRVWDVLTGQSAAA